MIKSIVFKTTLFVLLALTSVAFAIGWYVYDSQTSIISELQTNQKAYIVQKLANSEKSQIETELKHLKTLSYAMKGTLSNALTNADTQSVEETLKYVLENDNIKAVRIFDTQEDETFLTGFKRDGEIQFSDYLSAYFKTFKTIKIDLIMDDEIIGYFELYYDNSIIMQDIKKIKEHDINSFKEKAIQIDNKINQKLTMQAISAVAGGFIIIMLIIILLRKFVNSPLIEFQKGLQSFFDYLETPSKKVQEININTNDEFGQMTKSVNESIKISMKMHGEVAQLMQTMDQNVITSETDDKGIITHVSQAFCDISGYAKEELLGKPHNIVRHPDMPASAFKDLWNTLKENKTWEGEVKNLKKDGGFYWVHVIVTPKCTRAGASCGYTAIRYDITDKKEVEELTSNLEIRIEERTAELEIEKENVEQILANILIPVLITSKEKRTIVYANKFAQDLYETSQEDIINSQLDNIYTLTNGPDAIIKEIAETGRVNALEEHITTHTGHEFTGLLSVTPISYNNEDCYIGMTVDISEQKKMENEVKAIHKHTRESIEYAALIQSSLIPDNTLFRKYFQEYFVIWHPKDTVGGDIYLFNELRDEDECLIFCIDCTGHGVPGAFVTMLVKAVEAQLMAYIFNNPDMEISTAWVMGFFNNTLKKLLKQEDASGISNVGWDGSVFYYNKKTKTIKFSGAESPFFYRKPDGEIITVKGTRKSVGYKQCPLDFEYKETIIENVESGTKVFLTTDGYLDQNGGPKDFPFGKKQFINIIEEYGADSMADMQEMFMYEMAEWEEQIENNDRNDDMTVIGFTI